MGLEPRQSTAELGERILEASIAIGVREIETW
jgi:hypothetical protein